jgi:hypothetical protein
MFERFKVSAVNRKLDVRDISERTASLLCDMPTTELRLSDDGKTRDECVTPQSSANGTKTALKVMRLGAKSNGKEEQQPSSQLR